MAADIVYPTTVELRQIAQTLMPRLEADRPVFKMFPIRESKKYKLVWIQRDNYKGLQQVRGLNGQPARVVKVGAKEYEMRPGVYGEFITIDEEEITTRRSYTQLDQPVDITDLVTEAQEQLLVRRLDRLEQICWTLLTTGTFSVASPVHGAILHTDTFPIQTYTASTPWSTPATSTPLANLRAVQLLSRGQSVSFGAGAEIWLNQVTLNNLLANTNQNDLAGRRVTGLLSPLNLGEINQILAGENLPTIVVYDAGYIDDNDTFQLFIPNGKAVVIGKRPAGQTVGEYRYTLNANNAGAQPGPYMLVKDTADTNEVPREVQVHDGHNGGPVIFYPGAIVVMNV